MAGRATNRRQAGASARIARCCVVLGVAAGLLIPGQAHGAATSAVAAASASPPAFVPDWDGHTDGTVISYSLVRRSFVAVRIVDSRGRVVTTIDSGRRD